MNLSRPKTNKAEILFTLLEKGCVSINDFYYLPGFRTRISELVRIDEIPLKHESKIGKNKFGNTYVYQEHILPDIFREHAVNMYETINS